VNVVIKYLDEALGEVDAMDSLISSYKIHLHVSKPRRRVSCSDQFDRLWEMTSLSSSRNDAVYKSKCRTKACSSANSKTCLYVARLAYPQRTLTACTLRKPSKLVRKHCLHLPKSLSRNKLGYNGSRKPPRNSIKHFRPVRIQVRASSAQVA
jgi:hypothetical protein